MAQGVGEPPEPAVGIAHDGDLAETEVLAQGFDVIGHLLDGAGLEGHALGAAGIAVIDINELHIVRERGEVGLEIGVVHSGAAVENEADVLLLHCPAIGDEPGPLDVEVEGDPIDLREHPVLLAIHTPSRNGRSRECSASCRRGRRWVSFAILAGFASLPSRQRKMGNEWCALRRLTRPGSVDVRMRARERLRTFGASGGIG